MLLGRYGGTSSGPILEGRLTITELGIKAEPISFLVDTGSSSCLLGPTDIAMLEVDVSRIAHTDTVYGIGASEVCYVTSAYIFFDDPDTGMTRAYEIPRFFVSQRPPPEPTELEPSPREIPSLIGMEVIRHWRIQLCPSEDLAEFEILDSHLHYPTPPED